MKNEKVYIVLSHKHSLKVNPKTGKGMKDQWEVSESVEFVNALRTKHTTMSSAIGDFTNRKMLSGTKVGMGDYDQFEAYIQKKYPKQLAELIEAYREPEPVVETPPSDLITDQFGNIRVRTVFDPA
jgi:hypothetical protein